MVGSNMPAADVEVSLELVRSLLEAQRPDLAGLELEVFANGWDNALFRLGPDLIVRLPRRRAAAALVDHESRWLPVLAPALPLPVPVPVHVGAASDRYPWRWTVVPWFEGAAIGAGPLSDPGGVAADLGRFVAALHRPAPPTFPPNPYRGVALAERAAVTATRMECLAERPALAARVEAAWRDALAAPVWEGPPIWLHGDLHPANLIVRDGALAAVVDFGDITAGDPATDFLVAWALFDADRRGEFRAAATSAGRPIDDTMWARGRGWAVAHGLAVVAGSADNPEMHAIGMRTLEAVAVG